MNRVAPFQTRTIGVAATMQRVIYCVIPGMIVQSLFFGWGVVIQVFLSLFFCVLVEAIFLLLRDRNPRSALTDFSAVLTGVLLGLSLPAYAPWWCALVGSLFAIAIAKQLYGGLGLNPFNPAMVGFAALLIAFPVPMTAYTAPLALQAMTPTLFDSITMIMSNSTADGTSINALRTGIDTYTLATPLDTLKTDLANGMMTGESFRAHPVYGTVGGLGWEWINIAFLCGGMVLITQKIIRWTIPLAVISGLFFPSVFFYIWNPDGFASPLFHLFGGATMLGAFFIATDPVTASTTTRGRILYGTGIGVLVYIIRSYGGYPDAFAFAILLMNMAVPMIDQHTVPQAYGTQEKVTANTTRAHHD